MGCEGDSLPSRKDLISSASGISPESRPKDFVFTCCPISLEPLSAPFAFLKSGAICNYTSLVQASLDKRLTKMKRNREYVVVENRYELHNGYVFCPLTKKLMNGELPFIGIWPCGCVMAKSAYLGGKDYLCPLCMGKVDKVVEMNQDISALLSSKEVFWNKL